MLEHQLSKLKFNGYWCIFWHPWGSWGHPSKQWKEWIWFLPLCYWAGNSQTAPTIFFKLSGYIFFNYFIKNPQTTIALTFFTHIISAIGGVCSDLMRKKISSKKNLPLTHSLCGDFVSNLWWTFGQIFDISLYTEIFIQLTLRFLPYVGISFISFNWIHKEIPLNH